VFVRFLAKKSDLHSVALVRNSLGQATPWTDIHSEEIRALVQFFFAGFFN
jgi:hypothetical protein